MQKLFQLPGRVVRSVVVMVSMFAMLSVFIMVSIFVMLSIWIMLSILIMPMAKHVMSNVRHLGNRFGNLKF